jgi:YD repeat-containing protein
MASLTNENNETYIFSYDGNNNLVQVTDPANQILQYTYDPMDQVVQAIDRLGKVSTFSYDELNRMTSITDPTGVSTQYDYDPRGWLVGVSQDGKRWQTDFDVEGLVTAHTTPLGNRSTIQRDVLGYASQVANPLGQHTVMDRDTLGRPVQLTDPIGRVTLPISTMAAGCGLLTGATGPDLPSAAYSRDAMGLLTRLTDLNGKDWDFAYTPLAWVQSQTDPLQHSLQHTYDLAGTDETDDLSGWHRCHTRLRRGQKPDPSPAIPGGRV